MQKYILLWSGFTIIFYMLLNNNLLVIGNDEGFISGNIKVVITSGFISYLITIILILLIRKKDVHPYFSKLYKFRSLLYQLIRRDFKVKYKRSFLGIVWTILNPLLTMIILTIVFSTLFRFEIENYPVYLLSGQIVFSFFNESTTLAMSSVLAGANLIKKVNMPKYVFPLSKVLSSLINFAFSLVALLIVMVLTQCLFHWTLFFIFVPILYIFIFSVGVGLVLSAAVVFFRDVSYLYGILITVLTYLTPIFYPISIIPNKFLPLIYLNPMFHFVEYFRAVTIYGFVPCLWQNVVCASLALTSLSLGLFVFYKKQDRFILYI